MSTENGPLEHTANLHKRINNTIKHRKFLNNKLAINRFADKNKTKTAVPTSIPTVAILCRMLIKKKLSL